MVDTSDHSKYIPLDKTHGLEFSVGRTPVKYAIEVDGKKVALSNVAIPIVLQETHTPESGSGKKYPLVNYIEPSAINFDELEKSDTVTYCPYKGYASYYSVVGGPKDVAWVYETPYDQSAKIKGHLSFYQNKVIEV